jgi:hypothetical protein
MHRDIFNFTGYNDKVNSSYMVLALQHVMMLKVSVTSKYLRSVISGFHRNVDEICAVLGYYTASNGNALPMLRDNISPIFKGQEVQEKSPQDGTQFILGKVWAVTDNQ